MNICPNLSNEQIKSEFDQLVKIFGEDCAYLLWDRSNGMGLKLAPNGASSKLYQDLLELHNGDERAALIDKAKIYTQAFRQQFGKFGNTAQVKYYGPTMGKTTAAKTNNNLVDFDDIVRDDIEAAAKKAGLDVREYKKQGSEEYHNLLLDAIYKWRNDKRNVGKTLVVSNAVLAKDKIYDNTPMLPRKDAFVDRQVKRAIPKLSQIGVSFSNILNKTTDQDAERERNDATQYYDDLVQKWMPGNVVFSDVYVQDLENSSDKLDQNGEPLLFFLQTRHPDMFGSIGQPKSTTSAAVHTTMLSLMQLREKVEEQLVDHLKKIGITVRGRRDLKKYLDTIRIDNAAQMFIGKKARAQFEQQLRKSRPDLAIPEYMLNDISFTKDPFSDEFIPMRLNIATALELQKKGLIEEATYHNYKLTEKGKKLSQVTDGIKHTLDFLHSLEDNKENNAYIKTAIRWVMNSSLTLPEDNTKARQAFDEARKRHIDIQKYPTLGDLIASDEMKPKEKERPKFDPDKAKTFSNKRIVTTEGGRVFTVYDVENTEEGQREVCKALFAHYKTSPWCLSTFTATGEPTESAKNYWEHYNALPRKIAYYDGKPVAFNSDDGYPYNLSFRGIEVVYYKNSERGKYGFHLDSTVPNVEQLVQDGIIRNIFYGQDDADPVYRFTNKGESLIEKTPREAWWDMEDKFAQPKLSDSIVANPSTSVSVLDFDPNLPSDDDPILDFGDVAELPDSVDPNMFFYLTSSGEVYGFVTPEGEIYLDENVISPEHPIHEYTHLWDRAVAKKNLKLWKRGIELMKQTDLWAEILLDKNYGQKWIIDPNLSDDQRDFLIASEVHARLVGKNGEQEFEKIYKKQGGSNIVEKLKKWALDVWKTIADTFSPWTKSQIQKLTLDDFITITLRDFVLGTDISDTRMTSLELKQRLKQLGEEREKQCGI